MKNNSLQAIEDVFDFLSTVEQVALLTSDREFYQRVKTVVNMPSVQSGKVE
jgi:hypothetical protein